MGNTCSFHSSSSPFSHPYSPIYNFEPRTYQVFICHHGEDAKQNIASPLCDKLTQERCTVFLDKNSIEGGEPIIKSLKHAIRSALVNVVIFSPRFAESEWCLDEFCLMLKTQAPIVPLFWEIKPSEVSMEAGRGAYAKAFQIHKQTRKFKTGTLKKWKKALLKVSDIKGFTYDGDQGEKLKEIAERIIHLINENKNRS